MSARLPGPDGRQLCPSLWSLCCDSLSPLIAATCTFLCFSFPEAHFRSLEAQRQTCLPWAWKALRAQQRGKLSQQFRPHVLVEPLICWKYHLELSTALSDWVDTTGFWVNTKGFTVNTSCEVGTDQELPLAHSAVCWHRCLW